MTKVSVDARLLVARCEASDALEVLRNAVVRGRDALAAVEDLKNQKLNAAGKAATATRGRRAL